MYSSTRAAPHGRQIIASVERQDRREPLQRIPGPPLAATRSARFRLPGIATAGQAPGAGPSSRIAWPWLRACRIRQPWRSSLQRSSASMLASRRGSGPCRRLCNASDAQPSYAKARNLFVGIHVSNGRTVVQLPPKGEVVRVHRSSWLTMPENALLPAGLIVRIAPLSGSGPPAQCRCGSHLSRLPCPAARWPTASAGRMNKTKIRVVGGRECKRRGRALFGGHEFGKCMEPLTQRLRRDRPNRLF
jgi:hypothetical protein